MKKVLLIIAILIIGFAVWFFIFRKGDNNNDEPKVPPITSMVNSELVNKSVSNMVSVYLDMKNAFVDADTTAIKAKTKSFIAATDSLKLDDLKKDTLIFTTAQMKAEDIKSNAIGILDEKDITEMRKGLQMVSENLYPFLKTIGYKGQKLYFQNCPMAFGEGKDASWISNSEEIMNPYLGKNHPEYKGGMLHCGETKDSVGR
jgi:hypothetical protein